MVVKVLFHPRSAYGLRNASARTLRGHPEMSKRVVRFVPSSKICPSDVWPVRLLPNYLQIVSF